MKVLIAGCGWLGSAVAASLLRRGDRVVAVRRTSGGGGGVSGAAVRSLALDLATPGSAERLPPDCDAVVACQAAAARTAEAYERAYVEATRTLVAFARRVRPRRLVYTSSTGVFGQDDGSDVDERTAPRPVGPMAAVLARAERLVLDSAPEVAGCVVRLSGLYGPERYGIVERVRAGRLALGAGDERWMNFCHLEDAVRSLLALLERGRPGAVYHASDAHPTRRRDVVRWIAGRLGIEPFRRTAHDSSVLGAHRRVLAGRSRAQLGIELAYPSFRDGLAGQFGGGTG